MGRENIILGTATLTAKIPHDAVSWASLGFTSKRGVAKIIRPRIVKRRIPRHTFPIKGVVQYYDALLEFELLEATLANLEAAIAGASLSVATLTFGTTPAEPTYVGLKIVGAGPSGTIRTVTAPYGYIGDDVEYLFSGREAIVLPSQFVICRPTDDSEPLSIVDT
jgi:hypothetical protein